MEGLLLVSSVLLWIVVGANVTLTLAMIKRLKQSVGKAVGLSKNAKAPDFKAETLDGSPVTLEQYAGRPVAFLFVSPDCKFCRDEAPTFNTLALKGRRAGVDLVAVSVGSAALTREFVSEFGLTLPVLSVNDQSSTFVKDYNVPGTPFYTVLDAAGRVESTGFPNDDKSEWHKLVASWESGRTRLSQESSAA